MIQHNTHPAVETRQSIMNAGTAVFALYGYSRAQIQDIASAADIAESTFYEHFASKKQLYAELAKDVRDELIARGAQVMGEAGSLEERLKAAWDVFFKFAEEHPDRVRILITTPLGVDELQDVMHAIQDGATRMLALLLISEPGLLAEDENREARLLLCMEFIRCGMHGLARWWARHQEVPREEVTAAVNTIAWLGLKGLQGR